MSRLIPSNYKKIIPKNHIYHPAQSDNDITFNFNPQDDEYKTLKLQDETLKLISKPQLEQYIDDFNYDDIDLDIDFNVDYNDPTNPLKLVVPGGDFSPTKSQFSDNLKSDGTDDTEFFNDFDNFDNFELTRQHDYEIPKSLRIFDNESEEDFEELGQNDFFINLNKEKLKNLHKNLVFQNNTILNNNGFLVKNESAAFPNDVIQKPSKLPRSVKSSYNLNKVNEFKYKKNNSTTNLTPSNTLNLNSFKESSSIKHVQKLGLVQNMNKTHQPQHQKKMKYNPSTFTWEGNYQDLQKFNKIKPNIRNIPKQSKTHIQQPSLIHYDTYQNNNKLGKMVFDTKNLKWISTEYDDPFSGIVDLSTSTPLTTSAIRNSKQLQTHNGGTTDLPNKKKIGDFTIGKEFEITMEMKEKFQKEETRWGRKVNGWFEVDDGFCRDHYYELFDMVNLV